jgi:hypothetical protein
MKGNARMRVVNASDIREFLWRFLLVEVVLPIEMRIGEAVR